ncbi:MAG: helix-turn-helix transcriptional regulator, partial [Clostridia bacterium]|nr:helix-turn-helix transcriptional regulator [Clostridia bacterium]
KQAFSSPLSKLHIQQLIRNDDQPFGAEQLIQIHLEEFLIRLIRSCGNTQSMQDPVLIDDIINRRLADICQYLEQNIENKLTFSDVCQYSSMSESSLKKLFRDGIGCGAMEYYNQRKIERAKQYIREQEINFTEIADRLGYNSVQYFSLCFKKTTGMTPSQYARSIETMV